MKRPFLFMVFFFIAAFVAGQQEALRCGNELLEIDEELLLERENKIQSWLANAASHADIRDEYVIPVVIHILYTNEDEQLSSQQIHSQIEVLNEDFNAGNLDTDLIPSEFRNLKANVGFTFCLAQKTPDGDISTGIIYQPTTIDCIANTFDVKGFNNRSMLYYTEDGGSDAWDPSRYLNIWVGNTCGKFLGQTTGLDADFPNEDGVVIDYRYFGSGCTEPPFNLGRTTTHEIGHYFGLNHIFSGADCNGDDGIDDTPLQGTSYSGCPGYPQSSCGTRDMFMNFMDYVDDACMRLFTEGQKLRMVATLETLRGGLLEYEDCNPIVEPPVYSGFVIYPNPVQHCVYVSVKKETNKPISVRLFSSSGRLFYENKSNGNFIQPIPVEQLPSGIYFLRLEYEGEGETLRFYK